MGQVAEGNHDKKHWAVCPECLGRGRKVRRVSGKARRHYQSAIAEFERRQRVALSEGRETGAANATPPVQPKGHLEVCPECGGNGLRAAENAPVPDLENYPHVAIVGGGIGGVALAVACYHRGIPFTLYERDGGFDERSQGYGLTLQQASKAIEGLGVFSLAEGVISTRHVVHTTDGKVIGEWGIRKWEEGSSEAQPPPPPKRTNVHIARQALRYALLEQLRGHDGLKWGHQLVDFKEVEGGGVELDFRVDEEMKSAQADLLVGADGIRSTVRRLTMGEVEAPLSYLGCLVILGICPLADLEGFENVLLDSATVFQTANGHERIYMMPYSADAVMWQLSFPMDEDAAKALSEQGPKALKEEAIRRCPWHDPIPQILIATKEARVSGYPVYDRALLKPETLAKCASVTLLGDAAHPMSPFKGQGANQALLDALALARGISKSCQAKSGWREAGLRERVLGDFEAEMLERSSRKVIDSAKAAKFLHSETVLHEGDEPRGRCLRRGEAKSDAQVSGGCAQ